VVTKTPPTPERWPSADELSTIGPTRRPGARTRTLAVLRRLGRYDRAVYRSVAQLSTPLLDGR